MSPSSVSRVTGLFAFGIAWTLVRRIWNRVNGVRFLKGIEYVTPKWIRDNLPTLIQEFSGPTEISIKSKQPLTGGYLSQTYMLTLTLTPLNKDYTKRKTEGNNPPTEKRIVLKFPPASGSEADGVNEMLRLHFRESIFYSILQRTLPPKISNFTPKALCVQSTPHTDGVIVLEYIVIRRSVTLWKGLSFAKVKSAVTSLASVHASLRRLPPPGNISKNSKNSAEFRILKDCMDRGKGLYLQMYRQELGKFLKFSGICDEDARKASNLTDMQVSSMATANGDGKMVMSYIHGDLWANNLLLDQNGNVVMIDWQFLAYGSILQDLALLLWYTATPVLGPKPERQLVELYRQSFVQDLKSEDKNPNEHSILDQSNHSQPLGKYRKSPEISKNLQNFSRLFSRALKGALSRTLSRTL
ncbi:hypothetical protein AAMO2058_001010000 [Amorphochlora amoebiformis]